MRNWMILLATLMLALPAVAQSFEERLEHGHALLRGGELEKATSEFQKLRVDFPESELLEYSVACAEYEQAAKVLEDSQDAPALKMMTDAAQHFQGLFSAYDSFVRENARLNAANSFTQIAKASEEIEKRNKVDSAYINSILAYEDMLELYPDHTTAKVNLNYTRYLHKKYLQEHPPEEKDQQESPDEDGDESEEKDQGQEDGDNGEQDQEGEQEEGEADSGNEEDDPGESDSESQEAGEGEQSEADMAQDPQSRENIEAILQSLEDKNAEEQEDLRTDKRPSRAREGKWW